MDKRALGRSGLLASRVILGGNVFGWTVDAARSFEILDHALAGGIDTIDTADAYSAWAPGNSGGESETIIGDWLASRGGRDKVVICTKVGWDLPDGRTGLSRAHILASVEGSLKRLKTDYIDLYQAHKPDPTTPIEETLGAFAELVSAGKVRAIGASNYTAEGLSAALAAAGRLGVPRFETIQPRYNLVERTDFEGPLQDLCVREGLGAIPYYGLAAGFLTGKYRRAEDLGQSVRGANLEKYLTPAGFAVLDALEAVAAKHKARASEVALAWQLTRPGIAAPIASATSLAHVDGLVNAMSLILDGEDLAALDRASAPGA